MEDAIHVVGLPYGARIRLRYRRRYVDASIWGGVSSAASIGDVHILVTLAGTTKDGENLIQPLRVGRLVSARCEGDVMVLDAYLQQFPFEPEHISCFHEELDCIAPALPKSFKYEPDERNIYLQCLRGPPGNLRSSNAVETWEKVANGFFNLASQCSTESSAITAVPFLYYLQLAPRVIGRRLLTSGALDIEASRSVSIEVHTVTAGHPPSIRDPLGEVLFEISHSAASFVTSRHVRVDSRRDVRRVGVVTGALFRRAAGHLSVRTVVFQAHSAGDDGSVDAVGRLLPAKDREEVVYARYDFPLKVGRFAPWISSGLVALAAAIAAFKIPEKGSISLGVYMHSGFVFLVAFVGMVLGLRGDAKR